MIEQIEQKISDWQQGLDQLQAQKAKLTAHIAEVDAAIQRNIGAISSAKEILQMLSSVEQPEAEVEEAESGE
jgi:prefoldin subunit 5